MNKQYQVKYKKYYPINITQKYYPHNKLYNPISKNNIYTYLKDIKDNLLSFTDRNIINSLQNKYSRLE